MPKLLDAPATKQKKTIRSERGDFFTPKPSALYLNDGAVFKGASPAWQTGEHHGEVVFNTGMTGYVESLTDPSYSAQILVFTYPLIGNYGVQQAAAESAKIQVSGVVVSEAATVWSHSQAQQSLLEWLRAQKIPVLMGADTRALTKHLRAKGTMLGAISSKPVRPKDIKYEPHANAVQKPVYYNKNRTKKIILVDCGTKENILRSLLKLDVQVKRVPLDYDYTNEYYDGVVLSNGPGDPADYRATVAIARKALGRGKPVFGICLGSQVMGLAAGAKTYKLPFGHRGHNQPCIGTDERCFITSQNHGYAIDETSLPRGWRVSFRNLNDGSVEGIEHVTRPFFSVQFHPEACPGPTDTAWLFNKFSEALSEDKAG